MYRIFFLCFLLLAPCTLAAQEDATNQEVNSVMAGLSDTEARKMLMEELKKNSDEHGVTQLQTHGPARILGGLVTDLDTGSRSFEKRFEKIWQALPQIVPSFRDTFANLCPVGSSHGALLNIGWIALFIGLGLFCEKLFTNYLTRHYFPPSDSLATPTDGGAQFFSAVVDALPKTLAIIIFFITAYLTNIFTIGTSLPFVQLLFFACLITIIICKVVFIISGIIFSPYNPQFRFVSLGDTAARQLHRVMSFTLTYIITTSMTAVVVHRLGASYKSYVFIVFTATSLLILIAIGMILLHRNTVKNYFLKPNEENKVSWGRSHFASIWHFFAIFYLFAVWILTVNTLGDPTHNTGISFTLSFFALPLWFVFDKLATWVLNYGIQLFATTPKETTDTLEDGEPQPQPFNRKVILYGRLSVAVAIIAWFASLWGFRIPLISRYFDAVFDSILVCALSLILWRFLCNFIQRKIDESLPVVDEDDTEDHDEWGAGGTSKSRAYTLLPMLRKFIGTILFVMVGMTILSQLGVDIGPLLAGAGVIGLAIGFGAQKLVADVFSGFFYLLDDAFRVGEYLTAGETSGTVENISLRNVFIRHHLGMLQIVPHSEMGAITNFMRGGIIVKFNLDFPYDADIDKIRKIIKKVGIAMLEDEELKNDFIQPVKSQGVREISNSVMTIRVKFTAQPGRHFLIRREAYKRVTEALNSKGIYYAHRKVIVDIPEKLQDKVDQEVINAAGAAASDIAQAQPATAKPVNPALG